MNLLAFAHTALLAVGLLLGIAPAQAQIVGGTLYTARPGIVTMTLVEDSSSPLNWHLPLRWRTGPLDGDYGSSSEISPVCTGGSCTPFTVDRTKQLGHYNSPAWSNNAPGTTISSPTLPANNVVIIGAHIFSDFDLSDPNPLSLLAHTGDMPVGFLTMQPARFAAVFPGANHTVGIGFPLGHLTPMSSNFLDYSIRIVLSNVCVK